MKYNPTRYSSAVGEIWVMASFKVKYCHKIFDIRAVRELTDALFHEAFTFYKIRCEKLAFDSDHVHIILDMGLYGKVELAKKLKGFVAKHLFCLIPWLKNFSWKGGFFWKSGLWSPAYDIRSINNMDFYQRYLDKQKYSSTHQKMLTAY
ncbi:transposase [Candidatus Woesearchaeota archaeon]|nr:transposase [Candidatus Woesearchaeota archaeon]